MVQKILGAQRDFSFGEIDVALKRADDHPARKAGLRQMANARILNSGAIQDRPGRRALFPIYDGSRRTEEITMSPGNVFKLVFGTSILTIYNSSNSVVARITAQGNGNLLPWTSVNVNQIVYCVFGLSIYITFPGMRPQVITWSGVSTWSVADYIEALVGGQKRTPFYRLSPQNVTMLPNGITGNIRVQFSAQIASPALIGTRMRYCGRQILLTGYVDPGTMNALVVEPLPPGVTLTVSGAHGNFALGDEVRGAQSSAIGIVTSTNNQQFVNVNIPSISFVVGDTVTGATSGATGLVTAVGVNYGGNETLAVSLNTGTAFVVAETITGSVSGASGSTVGVTSTALTVQLLPNGASLPIFAVSEPLVGPSGQATVATVTQTVPQAVAIWDDEIMNSYRGFPQSCFVDQYRLGFCDFPAIPGGIGWSAINSPTDMYANDASSPDNAIFEIAPRSMRVFYVVPGPEGSEFVFCDRALWYIPISVTNPLKPGSVGFSLLSGDGCAQVQPRLAQEAILYVNAGQNSVMAVIATGAYNRPFNTKNLCEFHYHLFNGIVCIAAPSADGSFNERYAYVLNGDGSIAVGKYNADSLQTASPVIGWGPWSGAGTVSWISSFAADVLFTTAYLGAVVLEILDDTLYLDCSLPVNAAPVPFAPPGGKGPLWFWPSQTVSLMDQVTRSMGTYQIDANGFIIPQNNGGENLAAASLIAGQPWTMIAEPFCPDASPGQSVGQRMFKRRVSRFAASIVHSTGFVMARLFSGPLTRTSPALGTIMNFTRFPAWNQDDDPTLPPPQRETVERTRPLGRSFDPRVAIIKDTPGPLLIAEIGLEATI